MRNTSVLAFVALALACGDDAQAPDSGSVSDSGDDASHITDAGPADATVDSEDGDVIMNDVVMSDAASDGGLGPLVDCTTSAPRMDPAWTDRLRVDDVVWCTSPAEDQPLDEVMAGQARLWIAPGEYPYPPRGVESGAFALPVCAENRAGAVAHDDASGSFEVAEDDVGATLTHTLRFASDLVFTLTGFSDNDAWPGTDLDETAFPPSIFFDNLLWLSFGNQGLAPCDGADWPEYRFGVRIEGGHEVAVRFQGLAGSVTTGPSADFHATGTFDGTAIDIHDHYKIVYSPSHHHFGGEFAVFFEEPIRGACGIRFNVGGGRGQAWLIDCELTEGEALVVESVISEP